MGQSGRGAAGPRGSQAIWGSRAGLRASACGQARAALLLVIGPALAKLLTYRRKEVGGDTEGAGGAAEGRAGVRGR
ncbi:hypothetical protein AV530_017570 [Patagioenas fasciata monilis]|uniref:Uncharacterized protein n=1 Tax=Patagioenas fasciata monilis TaxID=372326 RepID=A0A1V4KXB1_PATFA|nr:hypothetical protein AV530_017570 [Patagioenas fasciata monilis]